jgi:hypothetical protein
VAEFKRESKIEKRDSGERSGKSERERELKKERKSWEYRQIFM